MPFSTLKLHPSLLQGLKDLGFTRPTADSGRRDPAGARRPRSARLRDDRQRQDRGVSAADSAPADRRAARHDARAGADADARAGGADSSTTSTTSPCTRRSPRAAVFGGVGMGPQEHAFRSGVDVIIGTPGRLLDHFRRPYAKIERPPVSGARRSGSDARHGISARHPPRPAPSADAASDAVLQRDDAAADRGAGARDAARRR